MEVREIKLDSIKVSQFNVRKNLNSGHEDASIDDLAASISEQGLLSPVVVRTTSNGHYELIVGQRRFLACGRLGMTTIPVIVRDDLDDTEATIISLVENVQRADMNPMDKAKAFVAILCRYGNHKRVARETGVSVATIRKYSKLLKLAPEIQDAISMAEGPVGVETLAILADTFDMEDQVWILHKIEGFNQNIQQQILKESGGDPDKIPELVEKALDGAFNVRMCREGLCFKISDEWKAEIKRKLGGQPRLL
jgi:ParB family chromosome partitioning protein